MVELHAHIVNYCRVNYHAICIEIKSETTFGKESSFGERKMRQKPIFLVLTFMHA